MAADYITAGSGYVKATGATNHYTRLGVGSSAFTLNNVRFPMYNTTPAHILNQTLSSLGHLALDTVSGGDPNLKTLTAFNAGFFVHALRLNHQDEGVEQSRFIGGFDSRGTAMNGTWSTTGATNGTFPFVYVHSSSVLRVGAARQIEVVH